MSTIPPDALQDIKLAVELGERLTLIVVFGPAYLGAAGLAEIAALLGSGHMIVEHRVDRQGPNVAETIAAAQAQARPIVLVSGLERLAPVARAELLVSLNLLRDTLGEQPAAIVMWIPLELADEFRQRCVDLFQWRTLTVYVEPPQATPETEQQALRHRYLLFVAHLQPAPVATLPERVVSLADGSREELGGWLDRAHQGLLLGAAGSGKSTELRRHAARLASSLLDAGSQAELPVVCVAPRVDVAKLDWRGLTYGVVAPQGQDTRDWLARQLATAPVLLLLDGLDEVEPRRRGAFEEQFLALVSQQPGLRVIVATREIGLGPRWRDWQAAQLEPLGPSSIAAVLDQAGVDVEQVMPRLRTGALAEIAGNPLMLRLLTELFVHRGQAPAGITSLAEVVVHHMLDRWDVIRRVQRGFSVSSRVLRQFMAALAASMLREGATVLDSASERELAAEVVGTLPGARDPLDVLAPGLERSGLLHGGGDSGAGHTFVHALFRDYFAGLWLVESACSPEDLADYAADPTWSGAVVHALAMLPPTKLGAAFDRIWETAELRSPVERWTTRRAALEGGLQSPDPKLRARILDRGFEAVEAARQAGEPPELWTPVSEMLDAEDYPC